MEGKEALNQKHSGYINVRLFFSFSNGFLPGTVPMMFLTGSLLILIISSGWKKYYSPSINTQIRGVRYRDITDNPNLFFLRLFTAHLRVFLFFLILEIVPILKTDTTVDYGNTIFRNWFIAYSTSFISTPQPRGMLKSGLLLWPKGRCG